MSTYKEEYKSEMGKWMAKNLKVGQPVHPRHLDRIENRIKKEVMVRRQGRLLKRQFEVK